MNLMIVGQKWFGAEVFKLAIHAGHRVTAVCAPMFTSDGRHDRLYDAAAAASGPIILASYHPAALKAEVIPEDVDLILSAHSHVILDAAIRAKARLGAVGYHPSLLPRHRGRDAVAWTLAMGDKIAGGTLYIMDDRMDAGPIIAQDLCHVRPGDDAGELWRRELAPIGLRLLGQLLTDPEGWIIQARAQDEAVATWEPARNSPRKPPAAPFYPLDVPT
jgi:methionyl-tRNA formyltransferase